MADISSIKIPNGNSYNFKDSSARTSLNSTATASSYLVVSTVSLDNQTIATGNVATFSLSVTKSGYTPIGLVGVQLANATSSGQNWTWCFPYAFNLSDTGTNANIRIRNYAGSNAKIKITVYVLYRKN